MYIIENISCFESYKIFSSQTHVKVLIVISSINLCCFDYPFLLEVLFC